MLDQVRHCAAEMPDDPANVGKVFQHSVKHMRATAACVEHESDERPKHVFGNGLVFSPAASDAQMQSFRAFCFREERPVLGEVAACRPSTQRITPSSSIHQSRDEFLSAASGSSIGMDAKALSASDVA